MKWQPWPGLRPVGLCKFDYCDPQQPALEHMACASPLNFLWHQCEPPATDQRISLFRAKHRSLADWHKTESDFPTPGDEGPQDKEKGPLLLDNEWYIFEKKDIEVGIIRPLVGIMLILILRLARSHTLAATLSQPITSVHFRWTNPWASKIRAFWHQCHPSSSL